MPKYTFSCFSSIGKQQRERERGGGLMLSWEQERKMSAIRLLQCIVYTHTTSMYSVYRYDLYNVHIPIRPPGHPRCRPNGTITAVGQICPMAGTSRLLSVDKYIKTQTQYPASAQRVPGVSARPSESSQDCDCSHLQIQV